MKPKFTLRDLFWLVLVAAICCAWWSDRSGLTRWHEYRFQQLENIVEGYLQSKLGTGPLRVVDRGEAIDVVGPDGRMVHK